MRRRLGAPAVAAAALLALAACGGQDGRGGEATTLTVDAAASLTEPFGALARRFEEAHEGVEVRLNLGGSSDLVAQVREGAPVDVVATADEQTMSVLGRDGLTAGRPTPFASNTLQIAVPPDNPARVRSLADLARPGVRLVVCAPEVPCGAAAERLAAAARVRLSPVSEEQSVTDVLGKVRSGEADAGLVYVTDVRAAGDAVTGIRVPQAARVVNTYPIAAVAGSDHLALARAFVALVTGVEGRTVLRDAGFGPAR